MLGETGQGEFRYVGVGLDGQSGVASLTYRLITATDTFDFVETIDFGRPTYTVPVGVDMALQRVLELLWLVAGTSYYKATAPAEISLDGFASSSSAAELLRASVHKGLAEFAYRNQLGHVLTVDPRMGHATPEPPTQMDRIGLRPVVPVGGGKDSIVTVEALKAAGYDPVVFAVNPNSILQSVLQAADQPSIVVRRRLDPQLMQLNAAGALNGHVPVTAVNSLIAVAASLIHGLGPVIMSNESSASIPSLSWCGHEINHQWSKGLEAEALLQEALRGHAGLTGAYFSLLRPLSELHIAKIFASIRGYDDVVTSCNNAFTIAGSGSIRWCGRCDKCRFVFLALAPFFERARLVGIFGFDLLADETQIHGYRELVGLEGHKPLDCVGDVEESLCALALLTKRGEWQGAAVVRALANELSVSALPSSMQVEKVLSASGPSLVPARYRDAMEAMSRLEGVDATALGGFTGGRR